MAKPLRTYFLCPHVDYPPSSIELGYIIPSPSDPSNALNIGEVELLSGSQIHYNHMDNFKMHRSPASSKEILPKFLEIFGFGSNRGVQDDSEDVFECARIDTTFFDPTTEYLVNALMAEGVQMYLSGSRFRKPLYMITGLKIARGGRSSRTRMHERTAGLDIGVDARRQEITGVPVKVGPGIEVASSWSESKSFQSEADFVFAFQLQKLTVKRERKQTHSKWSSEEPASLLRMEMEVDREDAGTGGIRDVVADELFDDNEERSHVVVLYSAETYTKGALF